MRRAFLFLPILALLFSVLFSPPTVAASEKEVPNVASFMTFTPDHQLVVIELPSAVIADLCFEQLQLMHSTITPVQLLPERSARSIITETATHIGKDIARTYLKLPTAVYRTGIFSMRRSN